MIKMKCVIERSYLYKKYEVDDQKCAYAVRPYILLELHVFTLHTNISKLSRSVTKPIKLECLVCYAIPSTANDSVESDQYLLST